MRITALFAAALAMSYLAQACPAQQPSGQQNKPRVSAKSLTTHFRWMRVGLVQGRINATSTLYGRTITQQSEDTAAGRTEKLTISGGGGLAAMRYEATTKTEQLYFEIMSGSQVVLRRQPLGDAKGPQVEIQQLPNQPLMLTLTEGDRPEVFRGATFWHLFLAEPDVCREHLVPLVEQLRPGWRLAERAAAIEESLLTVAEQQDPADRDRWAALVAELGSDRYKVRQAAERKLRAAGDAVVPYLLSLDPAALDSEQRFRLKNLIPPAVEGDDDTVSSAVNLLLGDAGVWLSLLERPEPQKRQIAARQLSSLLGSPIDFDPDADEATRARQIERLKAQLPQREPPAAPSEAPAEE